MMNEDSTASELLRQKNYRFRTLEQSHLRLEQMLATLNRRKILTTEEELQKKTYQKEKLAAKDLMEEIVRRYRNTGEVDFK